MNAHNGSALLRPRHVDSTHIVRTDDAAAVAAAYLAGYKPATRAGYERVLRRWGEFLAEFQVPVLEARRAHVDVYCRVQEEAGAAPATIAWRLSVLSGYYAYAVDEGVIARSPTRRVRRPQTSNESPRLGVDRDEIRALIDEASRCGERTHALIVLLALTGLRISEALGADVADLSVERGHRVLHVTRKGGKRQRVALPAPAVEAIETMLRGRGEGPLFATRTGGRLDRHAAAKTIRRVAEAAGIEHHVSPHSLRHGFVTAALDAGVPLRDVQDAAGHADPRTTRRYDRSRHSLDRAAAYAVAAFVA